MEAGCKKAAGMKMSSKNAMETNHFRVYARSEQQKNNNRCIRYRPSLVDVRMRPTSTWPTKGRKTSTRKVTRTNTWSAQRPGEVALEAAEHYPRGECAAVRDAETPRQDARDRAASDTVRRGTRPGCVRSRQSCRHCHHEAWKRKKNDMLKEIEQPLALTLLA